ncbi:MAG TPA: DNA-binding domain-containing protein [Terracidiphilus sp.]|jgi:hypothetical protein|nr:DNA-binding domain-containing protein [Terracidiphilus sp.]
MAQPMSLEALQREMASAIMMPLTADEGMRSHAVDGRAMEQVAASFVAPNSRLSAFERLEIYNRQYWFRVLGALREDFPAVRAVVGSRAFEELSIAYLAGHPSRSFTLRNLGSCLASWLQSHTGPAGRRHALAVDVARVEWAFVEAFDSAEREPLTLEQIATLGGGSLLALQPHVQLLALDYPADTLVVSLHDREKRQTSEAGVELDEKEEPPVPLERYRRRPTWTAAHRIDFSVYYRRLAREEYRTLCALRDGTPLGAALQAGFESSAVSASRRGALVRGWFSTWAELGWICAPDLESLIED